MGAGFSPSFANLFMSWWEEEFVYSDNNIYKGSIIWYGRYSGDLLIVWDGNVFIPKFVDYLNFNNLTLSFTWLAQIFILFLNRLGD